MAIMMQGKEPTVLFLDDDPVRVPRFSREWHECNLVYVRTFREFRRYLLANEVPYVISFDHDLATREYSGEDCAKWAIEHDKIPKAVIVHSWNTEGAQRIANHFRDLPNGRFGPHNLVVKTFSWSEIHL
jgi:hypothetical protein